MNPTPIRSPASAQAERHGESSWPRQRWWLLVALVFAAHVGLIFAFADRKSIAPRPAGRAPELRLTTEPGELLALNDPTLFALPHARGFAATAWQQISPVEFPPLRWSEPPRWLALPVERMAGTFLQFVQTGALARFDFEAMPAPEMALPGAGAEIAVVPRSMLRVAGDLASRHLLNPIEPTNWPSADLLTNSVVQVLVDRAGNVVSQTVLRSDSGSKDSDQQQADQRALELARTARFAPLPASGSAVANPLERLTRGLLIFEWHTVPRPATNAPPTGP